MTTSTPGTRIQALLKRTPFGSRPAGPSPQSCRYRRPSCAAALGMDIAQRALQRLASSSETLPAAWYASSTASQAALDGMHAGERRIALFLMAPACHSQSRSRRPEARRTGRRVPSAGSPRHQRSATECALHRGAWTSQRRRAIGNREEFINRTSGDARCHRRLAFAKRNRAATETWWSACRGPCPRDATISV